MITVTLTGTYSGDLVPAYSIAAGVTRLNLASSSGFDGDPGLYAGAGVSAALTIVNNTDVFPYTATGFYGIILKNGGTIINGGAGTYKASYEIYGAQAAIRDDKVGVVTNFGIIEASADGLFLVKPAAAIYFKQGGTVTNGSASDTVAYIIGAREGVRVKGGVGAISNFGTISTFPRHASVNTYSSDRAGVYMNDGGTITNGSAASTVAQISGVYGVIFSGAAGTVTNFGAIFGQAGYANANLQSPAKGVEMLAGGRVTNGASASTGALISGVVDGVLIDGGGTVANYGAINGGEGQSGAGVALNGAAVVNNFGAISGGTDFESSGVTLSGGGMVTNGSGRDTTAAIEGYNGLVAGASTTLVNFGAVSGSRGFGVNLQGGGQVQNGSSGDHLAVIEGAGGIQADSSAIVANYGAILATGADGVHLEDGGALTNGTASDTSVLIQGLNGAVLDTAANLFNFGEISGAQYGARLMSGGYLANGAAFDASARIFGYDGARLDAGGSLVNFGVIQGSVGASLSTGGLGAYAKQDATITNGGVGHGGAAIEGNNGVELGSASTLDNFGMVIGTGGYAVALTDAGSELIVEAGAQFAGAVIGDRGRLLLNGGGGTIHLLANASVVAPNGASTVTLSNFGSVTIGHAASFSLAGSGFVPAYNSLTVAGGLKVVNLLEVEGNANPADDGQLIVSGTISGTGILQLSAGGQATFDAGATLTVAKVLEGGAASAATVATGVNLAYAGTWVQNAGTLTAGNGTYGDGAITFTGTGDSFAGVLAGQIAMTAGSDALVATTVKGYVTIANTATVTLQGGITIGGADAISANGGKVVIAAGGARLTGGTFALGDSSLIVGATAGAVLTNAGCNIDGGGQLGDGLLTIDNLAGGVIVAGSNTAALVIDTGAKTILNAGQIDSFGTDGLVIKSAVHNTGVMLAEGTSGGMLTVNGAVTGAGTVEIAAATADFTSTFAQNVTFMAPGILQPVSGTLELGDPEAYTGTISGFTTTGSTLLDLGGIAFGGTTNVQFSGTTAGGTLTVTDGTHTAHIKLAGDYTHSVWVYMGDGNGGLLIHDPAAKTPSPPAFIAAAASLAPAAGGSDSHDHEPWRPTMPGLTAPRPQIA